MRDNTWYGKAVRRARAHPAALSLGGVFALYLLTRLLFAGAVPVFFDEAVYIRWTQEVAHHGKYLVSLTDGKPPLHVWWMVPFIRVVGDPLLAGRLASVAAGALTTAGMFLLGREIADWRLGAWSSLLYVACPFTFWYDRTAIAESLLLTAFVYSAWLAVRAARDMELRWSLPLGVVLGLALLVKGTANLLFLILPFAPLAGRRPGAETVEPRRDVALPGPGQEVRLWRGAGGRRLLGWAALLAVSYAIGFGIYSLLRLSQKFPMMATRTAITTRSAGEVLRQPLDNLFSNLGTIGSTMVVFLTPLLFAAAVAGLILGLAKRWRPAGFLLAWLALVAVVESLVARHWMFDTILPRFFLAAVPPLLVGAAYLSCTVSEALGEWKTRRRAVPMAVGALLLAALLAPPLLTNAVTMVSPEDAPLPYWIRAQYITDWPSGWGIEESARFLEREGKAGPVTVGSNIRGIGLPTDGLEMYLEGNERVRVVPFSFSERRFPAALARDALSRPVYVVFNSFPGYPRPPADWPLEPVRRFPKDGNESQALYLYRVEGGRS